MRPPSWADYRQICRNTKGNDSQETQGQLRRRRAVVTYSKSDFASPTRIRDLRDLFRTRWRSGAASARSAFALLLTVPLSSGRRRERPHAPPRSVGLPRISARRISSEITRPPGKRPEFGATDTQGSGEIVEAAGTAD